MNYSTLSPESETCSRFSRDKARLAFHAQTTGFYAFASLIDMGFRGHWPARPTLTPQIRFLYIGSRFLLHASFRPRLAATPLRFAILTSPLSGCEEDLHLQAVEHARAYQQKKRAASRPPLFFFRFQLFSSSKFCSLLTRRSFVNRTWHHRAGASILLFYFSTPLRCFLPLRLSTV